MKKTIKLKRLIRNLIVMAIYPRPLLGLIYLPKFFYHWLKFSRLSNNTRIKLIDVYPNLCDWVIETPFDPHYFYQSAWLARQIGQQPPRKHVDVGSDVKLIGILSAFVETEFIDYRPLKTNLPSLHCKQGDITSLDFETDSVASLSSLHVVEHIGLGRYGDPIDPTGSKRALLELQRVVAPGGRLYISVPVGDERVCFNAHRVFYPRTIIQLLSSMKIVSFSLVDDDGQYWSNCEVTKANDLYYGCGMFVFEK